MTLGRVDIDHKNTGRRASDDTDICVRKPSEVSADDLRIARLTPFSAAAKFSLFMGFFFATYCRENLPVPSDAVESSREHRPVGIVHVHDPTSHFGRVILRV